MGGGPLASFCSVYICMLIRYYVSLDDVTANGLRQRKPQEEGDIDLILQHHRQMHEKLAEELLHHTLNLKDFAYNSSAIVKKDIEVLYLLFISGG